MTNEKAHEILEDLQREMTENRYAYPQSIRDANGIAILAVEKQIPAKPYKARSEYYCPGCYGSIKTCVGKNHRDGHKTRHAYCFNCGQRIDWMDDDGEND